MGKYREIELYRPTARQ